MTDPIYYRATKAALEETRAYAVATIYVLEEGGTPVVVGVGIDPNADRLANLAAEDILRTWDQRG